MRSSLATGVVIAFLGVNPACADTAVGAIPGQFSVSESGAATYTIPIDVPPGIAGMEPKLSLVYNSQGGNGLLGVGWSLSGLSAITRCPRTIAQDGVRAGVEYSSNDKFCLDGQRLVATSGAYGANGTEYRTELENFAKVISYGSTGIVSPDLGISSSGPSSFKAWTKSGQILEYANTGNSRVEVVGNFLTSSAVAIWALNRIKDTSGNYLDVVYKQDREQGEYYPVEIRYTGNTNAAKTPFNSVRFFYESRPDISKGHLSGSRVQSSVRLTRIQTYSGDTPGYDYILSYSSGESTRRSLLSSIKRCDANGTCLPNTKIVWSASSPALTDMGLVASNAYGAWKDKTSRIKAIDVSGDGLQDLVLGPSSSGDWFVLRSNENGFVDDGAWVSGAYGNWNDDENRIWPMDVNGDGLMDIVLGPSSAGEWFALRSTGTSFVNDGARISGAYGDWKDDASRIRPMDVNGDGLMDIVLGPNSAGEWFVLRATATGFVNDGTWVSGAFGGWKDDASRIRSMDVNGDGLMDIVLGPDSEGKWFVLRSTGSSFKKNLASWITDAYGNWKNNVDRIWPMDVNGDGLTDIVLGPNSAGEWFVLRSTGRSFVDGGTWISGAYGGWKDKANRIRPFDINGDGLMDIVIGPSSAGEWFALRSTGTSFIDDGTWASGAYGNWKDEAKRIRPMDANGDGLMDIVIGPSSAGEWFRIANAEARDQVVSVTNGLGSSLNLRYKPLTDSTVYDKGPAESYPVMALQAPIYVVAEARSDNGILGESAVSYHYGGAKLHHLGRGLLGFGKVSATDQQTGITTTTEYRQDYPYVGLPSRVTKTTGDGGLLYAQDTTYAAQALGGTRYFPYAAQSVESRYDLDGSLMASTTTSNQYDAYGNVTQISVTSHDGHSKVTTNQYDNDPVNWILGRLRRATVTSTTP
jgi:hypothetical protein